MKVYFYFFIALFFLKNNNLTAQSATIYGTLTDVTTGSFVEVATVYAKGGSVAAESNDKGEYALKVPTGLAIKLIISRLGFKESVIEIRALSVGERYRVDVALSPLASTMEIIIKENRTRDAGIIREDVRELKYLPSTTGNLESVLPHIALGTNSGTGGELSSQYQVRGGNYDENLVYVNDFEIYRPQLIRAGQQEGLTFANIDLIRDLTFSSGGFAAKYGDKLSSVLDIRYKRPDSLRSSIGMSFLGGSAHVEGSKKLDAEGYRRFRFLAGARYKTTQYLLGTLDTKGEYTPNFTDIQAYLTYDLTRSWQLGLIGNYNKSSYQFIPTSRNTALGLVNFALQLYSVFEGQEVDDFTTAMGGVALTYLPDLKRNPYFLKFLASTYQSTENERIDITGYYRLGEINTDPGSSTFGQVLSVLGTGVQQQYVRNFLTSNVTNVEHKGGVELQKTYDNSQKTSSHFFQWSAKYQHEYIFDKINEWERLDSAGYSIKTNPDTLNVRTVIKSRNTLSSNRLSAHFQDTYTLREDEKYELQVTAGVRGAFWTLNREAFVTPRLQVLFKPLAGSQNISYQLSGGLYYQPPFYRELRQRDGIVNPNVVSQKSAHLVGGFTYDFDMPKFGKKKFRFIAEAYYKKLWDLVSYDVDNVRVRYSGKNDATGYVTGLDMRINGEFVPGAESWINLSLLRAREKLDGIQHRQREVGQAEGVNVADVRRPTDQLLTLSIFFQDYLPRNKNFKMHLNTTIGTGLPFGLPENNTVYRNTYGFAPYHRVDIGFAVALWDEARRLRRPQHFMSFSRAAWLSLEVFNLLKVSNTASNTWIKTIYNSQYAIPNYLTSRRINLRLKMDF